MSALLAPVIASVPELGSPGPALRTVVNTPGRLAKVPFMLFLATILGLGMVGLLVLNTTIQDQSRTLRTLQRQASALGYREAALQSEVAQLRGVENLAQQATRLGMRPNPFPAFIELPSGKIIGTPRVVAGDEMPGFIWTAPPIPTSVAPASGAAAEPAAQPAAAAVAAASAGDPVAAPADGPPPSAAAPVPAVVPAPQVGG